MSKIRKSLIVGVVLIMCVGILCACNNGDDFRNPINGEPEAGEFYTLQEAFDNGWLSRGDLRNIRVLSYVLGYVPQLSEERERKSLFKRHDSVFQGVCAKRISL